MRYQRRHRRSEATHTDDWLMTYADMITLLLCFFAVFLSLSVPKKDIHQKLQQVLEGNLPFHGVVIAGNLTEDFHEDPVYRKPAPVAAAPAVVSAPVPHIEPKGDRIITMKMSSAAFFSAGSATVSDGGKAILMGEAEKLKQPSFDGYEITVEGHTDDTPISTAQFPSNWELSTARAAAVVHFFLEQGIPAQRLRASGYADAFPEVPNRDAQNNPIPANQAQNRRVVIKLEKIEKAE